jgi:hypothetical protein
MRTILFASVLSLATGLLFESAKPRRLAPQKVDSLRLYETEQQQMELDRVTTEFRDFDSR